VRIRDVGYREQDKDYGTYAYEKVGLAASFSVALKVSPNGNYGRRGRRGVGHRHGVLAFLENKALVGACGIYRMNPRRFSTSLWRYLCLFAL